MGLVSIIRELTVLSPKFYTRRSHFIRSLGSRSSLHYEVGALRPVTPYSQTQILGRFTLLLKTSLAYLSVPLPTTVAEFFCSSKYFTHVFIILTHMLISSVVKVPSALLILVLQLTDFPLKEASCILAHFHKHYLAER